MVADGRASTSPLSGLGGVAVTDEQSYGAFTVPRTIASMVRADLIAAGFPTYDEDGLKLVFHSFRHTTGSWLAAEGLPLKVVQRILRYKTYKLTADRCTHVERRVLAEALSSLPDLDSRATGTDGADPTSAHLPRAVSDQGQNRPVSGVADDGPMGGRRAAKPYGNRGKADRAGFEPAVPLTRYAGLANRCLQPLGHLSGLFIVRFGSYLPSTCQSPHQLATLASPFLNSAKDSLLLSPRHGHAQAEQAHHPNRTLSHRLQCKSASGLYGRLVRCYQAVVG